MSADSYCTQCDSFGHLAAKCPKRFNPMSRDKPAQAPKLEKVSRDTEIDRLKARIVELEGICAKLEARRANDRERTARRRTKRAKA